MTAASPLDSIERIREFMLAGSATLTIKSKVSQQRFTYKIVGSPEDSKDGRVFWVRLLNGPDNEGDFRFLGTLFLSQASVAIGNGLSRFPWVYSHSRKSNVGRNAASVVAFQYLMRVVTLSSWIPKELEVWHEGRCGRCNRKLTVPESIASGFGPECVGLVRQRPLQLETPL